MVSTMSSSDAIRSSALLVDDLALVVGHVIVFEQVLADVEVAAFHLALGFLDGVVHHPVLDGLALSPCPGPA